MVSFGLLLRSFDERWSLWPVLLAGAATGLAYSFRNAGLAVIIAVVATFVLAAVLRLFPLREAFLRLAGWGAGVGLLLVPQWVWNYIVFGRLQSYTMPPSDVGLLENMRTFLQVLLVEVSGSQTVGLLAWDAKLFALISLGFGIIIYFGLKARWREWGTAEKFSVMLFTLYLIVGSVMVVLARTVYQWGELINLRHVMQYGWLVMAICTMVTVGHVGRINHKTLPIVVIVAGLLFAGRVSYWIGEWQRETQVQRWLASEERPERVAAKLPGSSWVMTNQLKHMLSMNDRLAGYVHQLPDDAYIISNSADVLKIVTGRAVRDLDSAMPKETQRLLENVVDHIEKNKPVYVLLFPSDRMLKEGAEHGWASGYLNHLPQGFSVACHTSRLLLLERDSGHLYDTCQELALVSTRPAVQSQ